MSHRRTQVVQREEQAREAYCRDPNEEDEVRNHGAKSSGYMREYEVVIYETAAYNTTTLFETAKKASLGSIMSMHIITWS